MSQLDETLAKWRAQTARAQPSAELLVKLDALAHEPAPRAPLPSERARPKRGTLVESLRRPAVAVALVSFAAWAMYVWFQPEPDLPRVEPNVLVANLMIEDSFGVGDGVVWPRPEMKVFDFEHQSPVKMVAVLHFQAKDISANEVVITVNGTEVGYVPPDTLVVDERSHEALIPHNALIRSGHNKIVFESLRKGEPWRIWNIWLEVFPLPELRRDELVKAAQENLRRGQDFWERRSIGAENLYKAWRAFREAWLTLESVEGTRPSEYTESREKMREAQATMDQLCSQLLLEAESAYRKKQFDDARMTLRHVNEVFPKRDHPCPMRSDAMRDGYEP